MDKKTQALVEQYARSLVEVAFEQDAVSTIQEEVRQILTVFAETNLKTFLSQENVTSEAKKESLLKEHNIGEQFKCFISITSEMTDEQLEALVKETKVKEEKR